MSDDALTRIAAELYARRPDEFTAARNARATELRGEDRELSGRIGRLKKPSPSAWVANLLAGDGDALDELLDLGARLREAQSDLDRASLSQLGKERRALVARLVRRGAELADAAGHRVTQAVLDELTGTLEAATADAWAGSALRTGRLVRRLETIGLDSVDLTDAVAGGADAPDPAAKRRPRAAGRGDDEARRRAEAEREEAEAAVREAEDALDAAETEVDELERRGTRAERRRAALDREVQELREQLDAASEELGEAERETRQLAKDATRARRAAEQAKLEHEQARRRLSRLQGSDA